MFEQHFLCKDEKLNVRGHIEEYFGVESTGEVGMGVDMERGVEWNRWCDS